MSKDSSAYLDDNLIVVTLCYSTSDTIYTGHKKYKMAHGTWQGYCWNRSNLAPLRSLTAHTLRAENVTSAHVSLYYIK